LTKKNFIQKVFGFFTVHPRNIPALAAFRKGKARPKVWRDISNYVELQWVVCVNVPPVPPDERLVASEDPDIGGSVLENSRERPVILTLADCKSMAQSVSWIWKCCGGKLW